MASKTLLLDLPNELFPCIFQYLNAIELLKAFSDIKLSRIQTLIRPFISRLDISHESDKWIEDCLSNILIQYDIVHVTLQSKHLAFIEQHVLSSQIHSMTIIDFNIDCEAQQQIIGTLTRKLKKLSFLEPIAYEYYDLASVLFQSDSQLEQLIMPNYPFYFSDDEINTCTQLTHLSITLEGMHLLFILIQHLPNLQNLKVNMFSQECIVQTAPNIQDVKPCDSLRSVTFTGWIKYFEHMETFFATFGTTIEYLTMDIDCRYKIFDGTQLERVLLDKMPRLSSLDLIMFSPLNGDHSIEIETFQSDAWQNLNPIAYWHDNHAQQHMLFTLPYKSNRFGYFSNEFVSTCVSNRSVSLSFDRVSSLSLMNTTPLNLEAFLYIEKVFPNVKKIKLTRCIEDFLNEDENENKEDKSNIPIMDVDMLVDTTLQIPSVKEFSIELSFSYKDFKTFRRFLEIFPNLVHLELYIDEILIHDILKHEHDDTFLKMALARIETLNITFQKENELLADEELYRVFPKVKKFVKQYLQNS